MSDNTPPNLLSLDASTPLPAVGGVTPCPVDRMPRKRRNQICIRIIGLGLLNFLAYTLAYAAIGGDAYNGYIARVADGEGGERIAYFVRGHFIRDLQGREGEVSRGLWLYSFLHSITVPITSAALIISMLVLARPHILATMRDGWIGGATFVAAFGTIVIVGTLFIVGLFIWEFVNELQKV